MANKYNDYYPNIAIPPGVTLKEYLEDVGMSQAELAKRTGITTKHISEIINGKAPISQDTSLKLENVLGIPASFWNNLEMNYQETKARLDAEKEIQDEMAIASEIPYNEIAKNGWISPTKDPRHKVVNLRSYFGVASLRFIPDVHEAAFAAFRTADQEKVSRLALATWLRQGEIKASEVKTEPFDKKKLMASIEAFRSLTLLSAEEFEPRLKDLCAACGIALVFVPHLSKTYAHGATRWLSPQKSMIQLSLRYKYADIFWFTFFHELAHIILHGKKEIFIELSGNKDVMENEADSFASKTLIPYKEYENFIRGTISKSTIIDFSKKVNVHPCIVVGRLQHDKIISYSEFSELRPRFTWAS
ncbi:MAG: HigA family addiction module antitoxin [Bacillota bacterium]